MQDMETTLVQLDAQQVTVSELRQLASVETTNLQQGLGAYKAFDLTANFANIAKTKWLLERKESGDYKTAYVTDKNGTVVQLKTFEALCDYAGVSIRKANEDIQNLTFFGESFMQASEKLGLGYRQMRALRKLPSADLETIIAEEKKSNDPEVLRELIEDYAGEAQKLRKDLADAKADNKAKVQNAGKLQEKIDKLQRDMDKADALPVIEVVEKKRELLVKQYKEIADKCSQITMSLLGVTLDAESLRAAAKEVERKYNGSLDVYGLGNEVTNSINTVFSDMCGKIGERLLEAGIDVDFNMIMEGQRLTLKSPCPFDHTQPSED